MLIEKGGGPERTDRLDSADGRVGRIEGDERNVSVGDDSVKDGQTGYGHDGRVRRVCGIPSEYRR